eukprot:326015-Pyramimonas_sp.AAC.1
MALPRHQRGCGAQGVVPPSASGSQGVAGVAFPRRHKGCAGGGGPMRFGLAKRGRSGTSSTPQG